MEGISDIYIAGIDEKRPPLIQKAPYIDLVFKLSHKAPKDWCRVFNEVVSQQQYDTKILDDEGLFIQTWVRTPDEVAAQLKNMQQLVRLCTTRYIEKVELARASTGDKNAELLNGGGEQGRLNRIVAALDFSDKA